jgi:hypothetical protein
MADTKENEEGKPVEPSGDETPAVKVVKTKDGTITFPVKKKQPKPGEGNTKEYETKISELENLLTIEKDKSAKYEETIKLAGSKDTKTKNILDEVFSLLGWTENDK